MYQAFELQAYLKAMNHCESDRRSSSSSSVDDSYETIDQLRKNFKSDSFQLEAWKRDKHWNKKKELRKYRKEIQKALRTNRKLSLQTRQTLEDALGDVVFEIYATNITSEELSSSINRMKSLKPLWSLSSSV